MQNSLGQITINLGGLTCTACEYRIEKALKKLDGVDSVKVSFASSTAEIIYNSDKTDLNTIYDTIEKTGYEVVYDYDEIEEDSPNTSTFLILLIIAGLYIIIKNTVGFNFLPQITQSMGYGMLFIAGLFTSIHCIAMCGGISLSLKGKSIISLIAGAFMIVMGINMLNITPALRKLMPRLPKNLTEKIDSKKNNKGAFIVGLLNGFMPCGPLQAMQLYALGTGSFLTGALSMFIFSLGTVPLMFAFGAFSSLLSLKFTKQMMKVTSVLVIILGVVMGNRGLLLSGINVSEAILSPLGISLANDNKNANAVIKDGYQILTTNLEPGRYQPINVYAGVPLKWTIVAEEGKLNGCNNEIIIPAYGKKQKLEIGENVIEFTPTQAGTITYTCWMGMISSTITIK